MRLLSSRAAMKNSQRIPSGSLDCHKAYCRAAASLLGILVLSTAEAAIVPANDAALPQAVPAILWKFDGADTVGTWTRTAAGPRPPLHPLFTADNLAAEFSSPGDQLLVAHAKAPSFKHGEALTFEFW